ncbi:P-loop containing nucleoside triphosphate hydrolase protein [Xylaria castorea]|nr:P-loop containing nucleoside triphosphate hydrolase protein [Xylaria castorea]
MAGKKRKNDGPASSTNGRRNKRQNRGSKKLNARKAELENQLESLLCLPSWQQDQSSNTAEYTPEHRKRDKAQLEDALLVLKSKIERKGQEQDSPNELFQVKGMPTTIRDYQVVGTAFMLRQERSRKAKGTSNSDESASQSTDQTETSRNKCRGGILADDMGIGKTVQSIACMLANPPPKKAIQAFQAATLIVVPSQGLIKQWTDELFRHGEVPKKQVCKYEAKMGALAIRGYPYVLATYGQVSTDFRLHFSKSEDDEGSLFEVEFYRIILDEGDKIKNGHGSTSKACCQLKAELKWVLSGTPLRNNLKECLPYFRFLEIDVNEDWEEFEKKWKTPASYDLNDRTTQILANIMLRREASQLFLGRNMCKLPETHFKDRLIHITDEEMAIYGHVERALIRVDEEAKLGTEEAKRRANGEVIQQPKEETPNLDGPKSNHRVQFMRLRQAVDHPFLLEKCIRDIQNKDELENLIAELEKIEISKAKVKNETPSSDEFPSVYELVIDIKSHLGDMLSSHDNDGCFECFSVTELQSFECGHLMCQSCYRNGIDDVLAENKKRFKCPQCGKAVVMIKEDPDSTRLVQEEIVMVKSEVIQTSDGRSFSTIPHNQRSQRSPGDDFNRAQPKMCPSSCRWLKKCDELGAITPSTKTTKAINIVRGWQKEAPNDKIVIFTEWIGTAIVLGRMLQRANIEFVYYTGKIYDKDRAKNLDDFRNKPIIKVMISIMAAGSVGLNITVANRMIIMNPWWNFAAEAQAFGRIRRHGQTKETYLVRLFAKGTMDERILKMQNKKTSDIREAMSHGRKPKPLSQAERRWLMGDRDDTESPFDESNDETLGASDSDWSE